MKNLLLIYLTLLLPYNPLLAQLTSCSVNAGVTTSWCFGKDIKMQGNIAGEIIAGTTMWTQVSGTPVTINNPTSLNPSVTQPPSGTYVFKLSAQCSQGLAEQTVTHIVYSGVIADAGPDISINCYKSEDIPLTGFTPAPTGFLIRWEIDPMLGRIEDNKFLQPSPGLFAKACEKNRKDTFLIVSLLYYNPTTGCKYSDSRKVNFYNFYTKPKIIITECNEKVDDIEVLTNCAAPSETGGMWSFISPINGGGASFIDPTAYKTKLKNLKKDAIYVIQWSVTTECGGFVKVIDTLRTKLGIRGLDGGENTRYFCTPPDSILLIPPFAADPSKGEKGKWRLIDIEAYDNLPTEALDAYSNIMPIAPYTYDSTRVPVKGFRQGFAYQFDYVIEGVCAQPFTQWIIVLGTNTSQTVILENTCGQDFDNQCIDKDRYCFFKPFSSLFIRGDYSKAYYVSQPRLVSAPNNLTLKDLGYLDKGNGFSLKRDIPLGNYIFEVQPDTAQVSERCYKPYFYQINFSLPPIKANAGTDVYTCNTSTSLPGNAVKSPNWYLLDKIPTSAATPTMKDDSTFNLKLNGLTPNTTYRYVYRSWGGQNCESEYDTITVQTANALPLKPSAGADQTACGGAKFILNATPSTLPPGTVGVWTLVSQIPSGKTPKIENPNETSTNISNVVPNTVYTFRFTAQNGCGSASDEIIVTTDANDGPNPPNAGKDYCLTAGSTQSVLIASAPSPSGATGQWSALSSNSNTTIFTTPNLNSTIVNGMKDGGTYNFVYTVKKGVCGMLSDTVKFTVASPSKANISDSLLVFCNVKLPTTITLKADISIGKWTQVDGTPGAIFSNNTSATTTVSNLQSGTYRFRWTVKEGICDGGFDEIYVKIGGATPIIKLGNDTTLCASSNGILKLNAPTALGFTGYWTFPDVAPNEPSAGGVFIQNTQSNTAQAVIQLKPGKTRLRWSLIPPPPCNGQPSFDDIVVEYVPKATISNDTLKICNGSIIELKANSGGVGEWSQIAGTTVPNLPKNQSGDNPIFVKLNGEGVYTFRFTVKNAACPSSTDDVTVINHIGTAPNIGEEKTLCVKDAILLNVSALPKGYTATWKVEKAPLNAPAPIFFPSKNVENPRVTNLKTGLYVFLYTITDGICTFSDIVTDSILINTIDAGADKIICRDTSVLLAPAGTNLKWEAYAKNPSKTQINATTGNITGLTKVGDYYFFLTDPQGCSDDVKVTKIPTNSITAISKDITICVGDKATLEATVNAPNKPYTLQWQSTIDNGKNWSNIANATNNIFITNSFLNNHTSEKYRIIISDAICGSDTSSVVAVTANTNFKLQARDSVCFIDQGTGNNFLNFNKLILQGDTAVTWKSLDNPEPPGDWSKKDFTSWKPNINYRFVATTKNAKAPCINVSDTVTVFVRFCCPFFCMDTTTMELCIGIDKQIKLDDWLCASNFAKGEWRVDAFPISTILPDISSGSFNTKNLNSGIYYFIFNIKPISIAWCNSTSNFRKILINKKVNSGEGTPLAFCQKTDTLLNFNNLWKNQNPNGTWGTSNTGISPQGILNPKNLPFGKYNITYTVKGTKGCPDSTASTTLDLIQLPVANAGADQKITCKVREVTIEGTIAPNLTYNWFAPNGSNLPILPSYKVTTTGTYTLKVIDPITNCKNEDSVQVIVSEPFITDWIGAATQPPCDLTALGTINMTEIKGGTAPFQYTLNGKKITTVSPVKDLAPGKYTLVVEDKNGCTAERNFSIERLDDWSVKLYRDTILDWGETMELDAVVSISGNQIKNVQWFGDGKTIDTSKVLIKNINPSKTTTYEVLVFDKKGCSRRSKVIVQVKFDPKVYAPNTFSPNDDGINDRFQLFANKYIKSVNRLDIFDRWGEWIYTQGVMSLDDPLFGWDGTFRNQLMDNSVFVWVAEVEYLNGEKAMLKGDVMLLR